MPSIAQRLIAGRSGEVLLAVASHIEAKAVRDACGLTPDALPPSPRVGHTPWILEHLKPGVQMVVTGVGKVNAAAGVGAVLNPTRHLGVISLGIAGLLPLKASSACIGDIVVASAMRYSEEGLLTPDGYRPLSAMGFPHGPFDEGLGLTATPTWAATLRDELATRFTGTQSGATHLHLAPIATVSTCSGTDALARQVVERTGALAEGMEGAAACQVAAWHDLPFAEVRILSNTTGDRDRQQWDMRGALAKLAHVAAELAG